MRIALAQLNPTVGDLAANRGAIINAWQQARAQGAALVIAPELAITGYPPRDLLDRPSFVRDSLESLRALADATAAAGPGGPALLVGGVAGAAADPFTAAHGIANAAVVLQNGRVTACHHKVLLPTYDVFDEPRYFTPGSQVVVAEVDGVRIGLSVCEDIWNDRDAWSTPPRYDCDPCEQAVAAGAQLVVNVSASPFERDKARRRGELLQRQARRHGRAIIYVNQVGGNDSLIFDGRSCAIDATGQLAARAAAFAEDLIYVEFDHGELRAAELRAEPRAELRASALAPEPACWEADLCEALCLGLRDYMRKCGFERVVVGLSGGVDSALTAALAVRALGRERVIGVAMPSRYSSPGSLDDAAELAARLGMRLDKISIEPMFQAYLDALATPFAQLPADVTEENLQARVRGALLMAYSNKFGALLLTTGNKSELAVGYCTLYGDMCGGLAVISDVYKTEVYALSRYLNRTMAQAPIPENTLVKAPSAELRPNQTDQDSLPDYAALDELLRGYVDEARGIADLIAAGHDPDLVNRVVRMADRAEYKRRQMPPGLRVSQKAFGEGRRLPIAQRYVARPDGPRCH